MEDLDELSQYVAFAGARCVVRGEKLQVALKVKEVSDAGESAPILIFEEATGKETDFDLRGTAGDVLQRLGATEASRGPGRPKLGVVAREVTLLPKHWQWLNEQPGGASVALRKLVSEARKANEGRDRARQAKEATYRFISVMAGNLENFEEAARSLYAGDGARFESLIAGWPADVQGQALRMAAPGFAKE